MFVAAQHFVFLPGVGLLRGPPPGRKKVISYWLAIISEPKASNNT